LTILYYFANIIAYQITHQEKYKAVAGWRRKPAGFFEKEKAVGLRGKGARFFCFPNLERYSQEDLCTAQLPVQAGFGKEA
jgi:hypothetical protein